MQWYAAYFFQKRPSQSTALNTSGHTLKVSVNGNKPRSTQWHWHNSDNSDTTLGNCNAMWPPCDPSILHVGPSPGSAATPTKISKEVPPKEFGVDNFLTSTASTKFDSKSSASHGIAQDITCQTRAALPVTMYRKWHACTIVSYTTCISWWCPLVMPSFTPL